MKAKTKFLEMFNKLPEESRLLIQDAYGLHPRTLHVIACEVEADTKLGNQLLKKLGYESD